MELYDTHLPWANKPVRTTGDVTEYWRRRLPESLQYHLPKKIWIFCDLEVPETDVQEFLETATAHLESEFRVRERRKEIFIERGLLERKEIESFLREQRGGQAWALYYSADGGLGVGDRGFFQPDGELGCVPCSSMVNHGVAWRQTVEGDLEVWLATARKAGQDWDWESDIGHESAHAAFAPVPLYMQKIQGQVAKARFQDIQNVANLGTDHLAKMGYMYSEIAVVALRGESRDTETGLPSHDERKEIAAFLEVSHLLMPTLGLDQAIEAYQQAASVLDVNEGAEIFAIAVPVLRVLPFLNERANYLVPPTIEAFVSDLVCDLSFCSS
jgi:hypothetical protein